jgi:alpha,alpha-trehalase
MSGNGWLLVYEGLDPQDVGHREALCTIGNGYLATRGALPERSADGIHYPGSYLAGVYNRLSSEVAGRVVENESLVNVPNWLPVQFRLGGGDWIDDRTATVVEHRLELDLRRGVLTRHTVFVDPDGRRVRLTQRRIVSMAHAHLAALETTLVVENWSGDLTVRSSIDGDVANTGVARYADLPSRHLVPISAGPAGPGVVLLVAETSQSHVRVAVAARTRVLRDGAPMVREPLVVGGDGSVGTDVTVPVVAGSEVVVEKVVGIYDSRDVAISEPGLDAVDLVAATPGFGALLEQHVVAWHHRWNRTEIDLGVDGQTALLLRLHMFHVMVTVSPHSALIDAGVPARGLHGEAYRGHVFWDELFIFPFFSLRLPELTRSLLLYRFRRLDQARRAAAELGLRGALFPWQSGSNGREETQTLHLNPASGHWLPDASHLQRHVNAAIAFNIWQYHQATDDLEFMRFFGAEMLLEIARMWCSLATYDRSLDRYGIRGVMGPDEYHDGYPDRERPGLDNNAYTNLMAVWCLARALEVLRTLPPLIVSELRERLEISTSELDHWDDVSRRMLVCFHDPGDGGGPVISQFEGYDRLLPFDWDGYRARYGDISRLDRILEAEGDSPNRYQLSKQADVLMLFYLLSSDEVAELLGRLGYDYDDDLLPRNIAYYGSRTSHGSTLSRVVHSWIDARRDRDRSWGEFLEALHSDLNDIQGGTTAEGVHLGAMAGTIDLVQRCYTGIELRGEVLRLAPTIPTDLGSLRLRLRYRGQDVELALTETSVRLSVGEGPPGRIQVQVGEDRRDVHPGESIEFDLTT